MNTPPIDLAPLPSTLLSTPVGTIRIVSDGRSVVRLSWTGPSGAVPSALSASPVHPSTHPVLGEAVRQLDAYFSGERTTFNVPIDLPGLSPTARRVLTTLRRHVAFGDTVTYGELARMTGTSIPARSVGTIMGINPVPLLIPCHRVVAGSGLGGFSGGAPGEGIATKRWLLEFEEALPPTLF